jgi:hypothetical protein
MISVACGGQPIKEVEREYETRRTQIRSALKELGLEDPTAFNTLWKWYGKWSTDLRTWASRREFISDIYAPLLDQLHARKRGVAREVEPTGWEKVDRQVQEARHRLEGATNEEQFQTVGLLCREILISVAQMVFDAEHHPTLDGVPASKTDAKRMLEAYISATLSDNSNEKSRKHARAAVDLAIELQHKRTADFRAAALCAEATTSVVNIVAIISGRRDPLL